LPDKKITFGIEVDEKPRKLFSLIEKKSGDLILTLNHAKNYEEGTNILGPIKQQRYSIHKSPQSPSNNTIKQTIELEGGKLYHTYNSTKAIKEKSGFCYIYSRRAPNLDLDRLNFKSKADDVIIDAYVPSIRTLVYSIFISDESINFKDKNFDDFKIHQIKFGFIKIVILWSYINFPSDTSGFLSHNMTIPVTNEHKEIFNLGNGISENECISLFKSIRGFLSWQYSNYLVKKISNA
jgi:hypothetical protein